MISEYFSDEELISQLCMFFTDSERLHIDFQGALGRINMIDGDTGEIKIKNRTFHFDLEFCDVTEVEI